MNIRIRNHTGLSWCYSCTETVYPIKIQMSLTEKHVTAASQQSPSGLWSTGST